MFFFSGFFGGDPTDICAGQRMGKMEMDHGWLCRTTDKRVGEWVNALMGGWGIGGCVDENSITTPKQDPITADGEGVEDGFLSRSDRSTRSRGFQPTV